MAARILIAEDDAAVRAFASRALSFKKHDVTAVEDGLQALAALETETFDLLITDVVMPGLDGIGLCERLRELRPGLPVLVMTGYAAEYQRAYDMEHLEHEVIVKPFTLQAFCRRVQGMLSAANKEDTTPPPPSDERYYA
ncbi:MAG: response regulator [Rhodovibrionaceae bacterium]